MSPERKKLEILSNILGYYYSSGEEVLFYCPKCKHHKRKLSVNLKKDAFKCWVCDYHGRSVRRLVRRCGSYSQKSEWDDLSGNVKIELFSDQLFAEEQDEAVEQKISLPEGFISLANKELPLSSRRPMNYLKSRNINKQDIVRWKIGYSPQGEYSDRIIVPSFGLTGYCNYFVSRTYSDQWPKYKNPPADRDIVFNELYLDWDEDVIIVEGVFDAIVTGSNSIPILGSSMREDSKLFQKIVKYDSTVYIALDPDAEKKTRRLVNKLLEYGVEVYKINILPYNDAGEMPKEIFGQRKKEAELMNNNNYLLEAVNSI